MQSLYQIYKDFSVEEFLLDEDFLDWVKTPTADKDIFWEQFLQVYPEKETDLEEAKLLAGRFEFKIDLPAADSADRVWRQILKEKKAEKSRVVSMGKNLWWAAAAILVMVAGSTWFLTRGDMVTVHTSL